MKCIVFLITWLIVAHAVAQSLKVDEIIEITSQNDGEFCFPDMSPDGRKLFFSTPIYRGIYYYDLDTEKITKLNDDAGAGYEFQISSDGKDIYYRTYEIKKVKKYYSQVKQSIETRKKSVILDQRRQISPPRLLKNGNMVFTSKASLIKVQASEVTLSKKSDDKNYAAGIENRKIALYDDDKKVLLQPKGPGIYLWPSVSPDQQLLLFTFAEIGTFISDFEGNILVELGYANYPRWSPDGNWIVYMDDHDDGRVMTGSDIYIASSDGKTKINLTNTVDRIEIYPEWGISDEYITFATDVGQIYLMILSEE